MARNPEAQTAFGPMVQVAIEQWEPPERRLVDDDLAARFLPAPQRAVVLTMRWSWLRNLVISVGERAVKGSWTMIACRKRYIADALDAALDGVDALDAVVVLGAGLDTTACRLARRSELPVFELDQPVNVERKRAAVHRAIGGPPPSVHLVPIDFENDDLLATLVRHGYRRDARTFVIWEGVTQYLTESAVRTTLAGLADLAEGSRMVFTYVRADFIDGTNTYGAALLYRRFRERHEVWKFGIAPDDVDGFLAGYGWRVIEQAGPEEFARRYVAPTGRALTVSPLETTVLAERVRRGSA